MRFSRNIERISMSKTAEITDLALSLKEKGNKVEIKRIMELILGFVQDPLRILMHLPLIVLIQVNLPLMMNTYLGRLE